MWTVSHKTELVNAADWKKERPTMVMIDAKSWTDIKKDWLMACRMAGLQCNVAVNSADEVIRRLDSIAGAVLSKGIP